MADMEVSHARSSLPQIAREEDSIICEGIRIDLTNRPLTLRLFAIFMANPNISFTRNELIALIYKDSFTAIRSERYRQSLAQNIVKLISRARSLADAAVNQTEKWIDWFVYQPESGRWSFYQLTPRFFVRHEED